MQKTDSVVIKLSGPFARELAAGANTRSTGTSADNPISSINPCAYSKECSYVV